MLDGDWEVFDKPVSALRDCPIRRSLRLQKREAVINPAMFSRLVPRAECTSLAN
eukprot:CAMPEP_0184311672 /NCGR_PEP_ID=MMETSP1049-20130417/43849_1 /TAXON_ID=77928 /ORGANISM="Proteomonas sulcata, Strain CCMP704" /LENGTH=53 /DNA_ID=CAMNT_0026627235 /DNA_START=1 /DNA_END=159 /DNA_ORIENTATION=-